MDSIYELGVVISAMDRLSGPVQRMMSSLGGLERQLGSTRGVYQFGKRMAGAGVALGGLAVAGITTGAALARPAMELEGAMAALQTVVPPTMGSVERSMANVGQAARDWTAAHMDSAKDFVATSYNMVSAGLDTQAAIEGTRTAMTVARATMGDSAQAAEVLARLYNNLGDKSQDVAVEMTRMGDALTKTQQLFQIADLGQLAAGLTYAAPAAIAARSELEDALTVVGQLNTAGLAGSQAGTAYASALGKMTEAASKLGFEVARNRAGGVDFIRTLESMKRALGPVASWSDEAGMAIKSAFGDEAYRAVAVLLEKTGDLSANLGLVKNSAGAAATAAAIMEDTAEGQWAKLKNNIGLVVMEFAQHLVPLLKQAVHWAQEVVVRLRGFLTAHPAIAKIVAVVGGLTVGLAALVGPILAVGGAALMALPGIVALGLPMLAIVKVVALIIVAVTLLIVYWDDLAEAAAVAWDWIGDVAAATWTGVKTLLDAPLRWAGLSFDDVDDAWREVGRWLEGLWSGMARGAQAAGEHIGKAMRAGLWNGFVSLGSDAGDWLVDKLFGTAEQNMARRTRELQQREIYANAGPEDRQRLLIETIRARQRHTIIGEADEPERRPAPAPTTPPRAELDTWRVGDGEMGQTLRSLAASVARLGDRREVHIDRIEVTAESGDQAASWLQGLVREAEVG